MSPSHPKLGTKYEVLRCLGAGSAGSVWAAENTLVGKRVAIKILHPQFAKHPSLRARFFAEARAAARLAHRNVVDVFDLSETEDGSPYIVMELLSGDTLDGILTRGAPAPTYSAGLMMQVLSALEAAHELGIIHLDLKPANIMVVHPTPERPVVKVLDFGIAHGILPETPSQETGTLMGTPQYMAPEQATGDVVDLRADLYAAGAILYELLTGKPVFEGESVNEILSRMLTEPPVPPSTYVKGLPPALDKLVLWALEKNPRQRPGTAREMMQQLIPFCTPEISLPPPRSTEMPIALVPTCAPTPKAKPKLELVNEPSIAPDSPDSKKTK